MPLAVGGPILSGAMQLLGSEAVGNLAKKFGGAIYERIFEKKSAVETGAVSLQDVRAELARRPTGEDMEKAFEALEARLLLVLDQKAAADRKSLLLVGSVLGMLQLLAVILLLAR